MLQSLINPLPGKGRLPILKQNNYQISKSCEKIIAHELND